MCARLFAFQKNQKTDVILPVTPHSVSIMFRRAFDRAGVKGNAHTHSFRHTMATDMERAGVRRGVIMAILGHSAASTTDGYIHVPPEEMNDSLNTTMAWRRTQRTALKTTRIDGVEILEAAG